MFSFLDKLLGKTSQRPARTLALYGSQNAPLDLLAGLDWVLKWSEKLGLPKAEWVTWNYGQPGNLQYKTYSLDAWIKQGRQLPASICSSVEIGRDEGKKGLGNFVWYACMANEPSFTLCADSKVCLSFQLAIEPLVLDIQEVAPLKYGYSFEMGMEKGPVFFVNGGTLNGRKFFSQVQIEEIAKWTHAKGESEKLGLPVSDLLRDIFPLNFLNPHHLAMQVKGQSLKDWIDSDPKRGSLRPLIDDTLWTWSLPENRIQAIRKVLEPQRLLISWGDFDTPSGGPLGHTYGAKQGEKPVFKGKPLTKDDARWIAEGLEKIKPIFTRYTGESPEHFDKLIALRQPLFGKLLDLAFTAWSEDARPDRPAPDEALHAFAAALGEHLVKHYRMVWYTVEDENGRGLAVCHRGPGGALTWAHPIDSVAKRIDRGETGFVAGIVAAVGEQIKQP